ncbi:MAG: hypothetical protein ABSC94_27335 [Polyangiaceae bacterium]|jgi:hypothetical protein
MSRPTSVAIGIFLLCLCIGRRSSAAPPPSVAGEASSHFERGIKLTDDEDWRAALVEFERAYVLDPNYRVLFDIGQCRYVLHDYPGALDAFRRYLAEGKDLVPPDRRAKVASDIEVLKGRVASVRVLSSIAGAEVTVDDVVVGTTPLPSPVMVSSGRRKFTATKDGTAIATRFLDLAGEETASLALDPVVSIESPPNPSIPPLTAVGGPPESQSARRPIAPAWVALAFGAAAVGVGSYFGVTAMDDKMDLDRQCVAKTCPTSSQSLISAAQRNSLFATIGFGVGGAALAGGLIYYAIAAAPVRTPSSAPRLGFFIDRASVGAAGTF